MPNIDSRRAPWFAILIFIAAWFCVDGILIAPDFGQLDIYYFKDAGINFAEGLGLTTRFTYGNPTFAYRDYAQYPPIYPLTFGLYAKAAGVSALSNQLFNSLVAMLAGVAGFLALRPIIARTVSGRSRAWLEPVIAIASIATGYFYLSCDRPDGLAVALGIAALIHAIRGATSGSAMTAGALCALTVFTSPFAGLWTALAAAIGILTVSARTLPVSLRRLVWMGFGGCTAAIGLLALLRMALPGWFDGFLGVATGSNTHNETGGGYFLALLKGDVHAWWSGFGYSRPEHYVLLIKLCAVAGALMYPMIMDFVQPRGKRRAARLLPLLIVSPICLITAPYQSNYATITAALLLAGWASIEAAKPLGSNRGAAIAILLAFSVNVVLTVPFQARDLLVRFSTRESLPRALAYLESHRKDLEADGGYSAVSPTNYILWRQAGLHPLNSIYSGFRDPASREKLNVLALSYPGSGDLLRPQEPEFIPENEYVSVFQPVLPQPAVVGGHVLSRSSQTWESAVYRRRTCESCSASR
jgi:hypothetical protein